MSKIYQKKKTKIPPKIRLSIFSIEIADDGALPTEWEAVSHPHQPPDLILPSNAQNPQQTASVAVAGGFVQSAVQSIWRVLTTGNRQ